MATRDDWIQDVIANVGCMLDAARATVEDLYQRYVPEQQRSQAEHLYKTYAPDIIPRHWSPTRTPDIDIVDLGIELHLVADLPGVKKEDIDIELMPDTIDITAEPQAEVEREQELYACRERSCGYKRRINLPATVIPEKAKARFNNGVLEVTMPRKEPVEKVKAVKVNVKDTGGQT